MVRTRIDAKKNVKVRRTTKKQSVAHKPIGFWYSVNRDWERWCRSEQRDWIDGHYIHNVTLGDENMLFITTLEELDVFHGKYSSANFNISESYYIDWDKVSKEFDGIEIAPYQWDRRLDHKTVWYYTWDCASGCIWRPKGIKVVPHGGKNAPRHVKI